MERFWEKVERTDECWLWKGAAGPHGYGTFWVAGKYYRAHRFAWQLEHGAVPTEFICHTCDNRLCVRPSHLFVGTHQENMKDMQRKGRGALGDKNGSRKHPERLPRGASHGMARLSADQVAQIHELRAAGKLQREIAPLFGISRQHVSSILSGQSWIPLGGTTL